MKRITTVRALTGLCLCGAVVAGVRTYLDSQGTQAPKIALAIVTRGRVAEEVSATGTLEAVTAVQVGSQVSGTIAWLGADFNSIVRKGDVIARLDPALLQAQVDQSRASLVRTAAEAENARAQLANAQQKQDRISALFAKGVVAESELDVAALALSTAQAQVKSVDAQAMQARAALEQNQASLAKSVILSPIDGIVTQRSVDVGQTVSASMSSPTLFIIAADLREMQVKAGIDESDIGRIRPSQAVTFQVDAYPGQSFRGGVRQVRLEPTLLQNVITYSVIIDASNADLVLKPGMTANLKIEIARQDDAIRIPNNALRFKPSAETFAMLGQAPAGDIARVSDAAGVTDAVVRAVDMRTASEAPPAPTRAVPLKRAETIDALFAPLKPVETQGVVWVNRDDKLTAVPVTLGLSDGQISVLLDGDLDEGDELVTNVVAATAAVRATPQPAGGLFMSVPGAGGRGRIG